MSEANVTEIYNGGVSEGTMPGKLNPVQGVELDAELDAVLAAALDSVTDDSATDESVEEKGTDKEMVTPEFVKITRDFYTDLRDTFPEYTEKLTPVLDELTGEQNLDGCVLDLFKYCKEVYPSRFFDILYQNDKIFTTDDINTEFVPGINNDIIWTQDITDKTRMILWKYLQLMCFTVVHSQDRPDSFGEATSLFETINEEELKNKLTDTMEQMAVTFGEGGTVEDSGLNSNDIPDAEDLHKHITGLMDGKLGKLAADITEETMKDFEGIEGVESINDVFKVMFKDPGKLMSMVKKVGGNIDEKLKSGEINESELMEEATKLMGKLKGMPGMGDMQKMMEGMGLPGLGSGGAGDSGTFKGQMKRNTKTNERLRRKLENRKLEKESLLKEKRVVLAAPSQEDQILILQKQLEEARAGNTNKKKKKKKRRNKKE